MKGLPIYTMEQWRKDGELRLTEGQRVAHEVIIELRDSVPPTCWGSFYFQPGEGYDCDAEYPYLSLYQTFSKNLKGEWIYRGLCLAGADKPRMGYSEKMRRAGI